MTTKQEKRKREHAIMLAKEVRAFCRKYLFPALDQAAADGQRANVLLFSLLECMQMNISANHDTREEAIEQFKVFAGSYVHGWENAAPGESPFDNTAGR